MKKYILAGCDLHDKTMLLKVAQGAGKAKKHSFENNAGGRRAMIQELKNRATQAGGAQCVLAYEASGLGFGLYDELSAQGIPCHVLAPSKIERSPKQRRSKTDEKDAERLLEILRGHYLVPVAWAV